MKLLKVLKHRSPQEERDEDRVKEDIERSVAYLKAQVRVLDARVSTLEHEHNIEGTG